VFRRRVKISGLSSWGELKDTHDKRRVKGKAKDQLLEYRGESNWKRRRNGRTSYEAQVKRREQEGFCSSMVRRIGGDSFYSQVVIQGEKTQGTKKREESGKVMGTSSRRAGDFDSRDGGLPGTRWDLRREEHPFQRD